ncbi:hypothetical protein BH10CYA1_BH10CYA1_17650 [soil metagenome]
MQSYTEVNNKILLNAVENPDKLRSPARDVTQILALSALVTALAFQTVKVFGLAYGIDEHVRLTLSYLGLGMCLVAAPTFLIFGRHMSARTGFTVAALFIFSVTLVASMVV